MATRLYVNRSVDPTVTPTSFNADWDLTSGVTLMGCSPNRLGGVIGTFGAAETSATAPYDVLLLQLVSPPLAAQTISGAVKGQFIAAEPNAGADAQAQFVARVVNAAGVVQAELNAMATTALGVYEFSTTPTNRKFPIAAVSPLTVTSHACADGDRLVVEIGWRAHNTTTTSRTANVRVCDDGATDLPEDETDTDTAKNPWIEFSTDIVWSRYPAYNPRPQTHVRM